MSVADVSVLQRIFNGRVIHLGGLIVIGSLALFHFSIAPVMFKELSGPLVWYVGIDLCRAFQIFLNAAALSVDPVNRMPWRLAHIANVLCVALDTLNLASVADPINVVVLIATGMIAVGLALRDPYSIFKAASNTQPSG